MFLNCNFSKATAISLSQFDPGKTITEEFVVDAYCQDEAEHFGREKAENFSDPEGSELEDVTVDSSELDRGTYLQDEIDFLEEEVL